MNSQNEKKQGEASKSKAQFQHEISPESGARSTPNYGLLALVTSAALYMAYLYHFKVSSGATLIRLQLHDEILTGVAGSPYRYRVLVPMLCEALIWPLSWCIERQAAFVIAYTIYETAAILSIFGSLYLLLRLWFSIERATIGLLFVAVTLPVSFENQYFQPWTLLETTFFALGLYCIFRDKFKPLLIVTLLASLNRETGVFVALAYLFVYPSRRKEITLLFGAWLFCFIGLRCLQGSAPHVVSLVQLAWQNIDSGTTPLTNAAMLLNIGGVLALLGYRRAPEMLRRAACIIPFYLAMVLVFGVWIEVRMLVPLYPLLLPLAMVAVFRSQAISAYGLPANSVTSAPLMARSHNRNISALKSH